MFLTKTKIMLILAVSLSFLGFQAIAEEEDSSGTTKAKIEDVKKGQKKGDDIDTEITNAKLRAEAGSKSMFSMSATISYSGGQIDKPFDANRPNNANSPNPPRTEAGGSVSARYRIDKSQSMTFGTGYSVIQPLHGAKDSEISNPSLGYKNSFKAMGLQNSSSASVTFITDKQMRDKGDTWSFDVGHTMLSSVGNSKLTAGFAAYTGYSTFDKDAASNQVDYYVSGYPFLEYGLSDRFSLRSVFQPWRFLHFRTDSGTKFTKQPWTQSLGLSSAVARNVFIYPYIIFVPENMRKDNTTVAIYTTFNLF